MVHLRNDRHMYAGSWSSRVRKLHQVHSPMNGGALWFGHDQDVETNFLGIHRHRDWGLLGVVLGPSFRSAPSARPERCGVAVPQVPNGKGGVRTCDGLTNDGCSETRARVGWFPIHTCRRPRRGASTRVPGSARRAIPATSRTPTSPWRPYLGVIPPPEWPWRQPTCTRMVSIHGCCFV